MRQTIGEAFNGAETHRSRDSPVVYCPRPDKNPCVTGLSRVDLLEALRNLSQELQARTPPRELLLVGGAAMVLVHGRQRSTRDVDVVVTDSELRSAAQRVSAKLLLPEDWLNDGAKGYVHGIAVGEVVLETPSLIVRAVAPNQLLAMKLSAWRDDIDIEDARVLLATMSGARDDVWKRIELHLVPGRELKARYAFEDLWERDRGTS
jgi:hypothetical protein